MITAAIAQNVLPSRFAFVLATWSLGLAACGGGGGGASPDAGGGSGKSRPVCTNSPASPTLPATFGISCGAGSNYALCAITSPDQCLGGSCLWDGKLSQAYCTIGCDGSANSCPAQYSCSAQSCTSGPAKVCARTGSDGSPACATVTSDYTLTLGEYAKAADGRLYIFAQKTSGATTVFSKTQAETTWTNIFERPAFAVPSGNAGYMLTTPDAVYYVLWSGKLLRLSGVTVTEESYETCAGVGDCKYGGLRMFQTPAGKVRGFSNYGPVFERDAQGTWTSVMAEAPAGFQPMAPFATSGFWGRCQAAGAVAGDPYDQPCFGSQGDDLTIAPLPDGDTSVDWDTAVLGDTPADFLLFANSGNLFHRVGGAWIKEGLPAPDSGTSGGELARFADGSVYALRNQNTQIFTLAGTCWQLVPGSVYSSGLPLDNKTLGYVSMSSWCEAPLP